MNNLALSPLHSLQTGSWFKLICGASYQHLPSIRNLALVYTLAGADCIDMAPDPAVIHAVQDGITVAQKLALAQGGAASGHQPWLMVSFNDGEDPHFRKAVLVSHNPCPVDCHRPCEPVCPTQAIAPTAGSTGYLAGHQVTIAPDLCYGCGRCLNICPSNLIVAQEQVYYPEFLWQDLARTTATSVPAPQFSPTKPKIDAIEIHTQPYRVAEFRAFWQRIAPIVPTLQLMAVSFPDCDNLEVYLRALLDCMEPRPRQLIWQTDGRPMSGDIGQGTTHAALALARKVLDFQLPLGFVQLAGGTNHSTVTKMRQHQINAAGVAYGSYGRKILAELLDHSPLHLETDATALEEAVKIAQSLVSPLKE